MTSRSNSQADITPEEMNVMAGFYQVIEKTSDNDGETDISDQEKNTFLSLISQRRKSPSLWNLRVIITSIYIAL